jgi:hypothetical protein
MEFLCGASDRLFDIIQMLRVCRTTNDGTNDR